MYIMYIMYMRPRQGSAGDSFSASALDSSRMAALCSIHVQLLLECQQPTVQHLTQM